MAHLSLLSSATSCWSVEAQWTSDKLACSGTFQKKSWLKQNASTWRWAPLPKVSVPGPWGGNTPSWKAPSPWGKFLPWKRGYTETITGVCEYWVYVCLWAQQKWEKDAELRQDTERASGGAWESYCICTVTQMTGNKMVQKGQRKRIKREKRKGRKVKVSGASKMPPNL